MVRPANNDPHISQIHVSTSESTKNQQKPTLLDTKEKVKGAVASTFESYDNRLKDADSKLYEAEKRVHYIVKHYEPKIRETLNPLLYKFNSGFQKQIKNVDEENKIALIETKTKVMTVIADLLSQGRYGEAATVITQTKLAQPEDVKKVVEWLKEYHAAATASKSYEKRLKEAGSKLYQAEKTVHSIVKHSALSIRQSVKPHLDNFNRKFEQQIQYVDEEKKIELIEAKTKVMTAVADLIFKGKYNEAVALLKHNEHK